MSKAKIMIRLEKNHLYLNRLKTIGKLMKARNSVIQPAKGESSDEAATQETFVHSKYQFSSLMNGEMLNGFFLVNL